MESAPKPAAAKPAEARVARVRPDADMEELARLMKVLASPRRLHLLQFLAEPHYLEEIASELKLSRAVAQEHVGQLVEAGLVEQRMGRRANRSVTDYVAVPERLYVIEQEFRKVAARAPLAEGAPRRATDHLTSVPAARAAASKAARLLVVHGRDLGQAFPLAGEGPWLLGREPDAACVLAYDPYVSLRHAEVRRAGAGYELADLYSSNGTYLDWARVPRGGALALRPGGVVGVGMSLLLFRGAE